MLNISTADQLNEMADRFLSEVQADPATADLKGWGQFLNVPRQHRQIGSYGTAAALIVLSLADRERAFTPENINCIASKWAELATAGTGKRFCQNVRLAFFHLALLAYRNANPTPAAAITELLNNVRQELIKRYDPNIGWGDWWVSATRKDQRRSAVATSAIVLSFALFESSRGKLPAEVVQSIEALERDVQASQIAERAPSLISVAAIAAVQREKVSRSTKKALLDLASRISHPN